MIAGMIFADIEQVSCLYVVPSSKPVLRKNAESSKPRASNLVLGRFATSKR